jgi:2-methylcitrate dehydratase PrpD
MKKKAAAPERTLARKLAEHHAKLSYSRIPADSRHAMKRLLLDYIGVAIAGSLANKRHCGCFAAALLFTVG